MKQMSYNIDADKTLEGVYAAEQNWTHAYIWRPDFLPLRIFLSGYLMFARELLRITMLLITTVQIRSEHKTLFEAVKYKVFLLYKIYRQN